MKKIITSLLLIISFAISASAAENIIVDVLCYHSFLKKTDPYSFSNEELDSQLQFFRDKGYTFVNMNDIRSGNISGRKNILVTVDDGNKSVYDAYFKVFKKYGIKPVIGIYPAIIEKKDYALSWDAISELSKEGCEIASHGYNHLYVNKKLFDNDIKAFNREIYLSKEILEKKLNRKIEVFIYPFGVRSDITIEHLKKAGYKFAFTIVNGDVLVPSGRNKNNFELPRYMLTKPTWKMSLNVIARKSGSSKQQKASADIKEPVKEKKQKTATAMKEPPEEKYQKTSAALTDKKIEKYYAKKEPDYSNSFGVKNDKMNLPENMPYSTDSGIVMKFAETIKNTGFSENTAMAAVAADKNQDSYSIQGIISFFEKKITYFKSSEKKKPDARPEVKEKKENIDPSKIKKHITDKNHDLQNETTRTYSSVISYFKDKVLNAGDKIQKLFKQPK
jgi:peptidoglycan/xylan/chitin deacetylase (PgdA/CDA1 family)